MRSFDVDEIRKDFPILSKPVNDRSLIYLDNAATSQKPLSVTDGIKYFYENLNANPMRSIHSLAEKATEAYTGAREKVARFINASPDEIIFVRNSTEAINLVSMSLSFSRGDRVATTYLEHHSNMLPWMRLKSTGIDVDIVGVDENFDLDMGYYKELKENTKLVTVTHESNVSGTINDVKTISNLAHKAGALAFVDAAQSVPHMKVDVKDLGADFLCFSGHKMLGPLGIGVLYMARDVQYKMRPFLLGGEMIKSVKLDKVEYQDVPAVFEAGTQNVEGAYGLGLAMDYLNRIGMQNIEAHEKALTNHLYKVAEDVYGINVYSGRSHDRGAIFSFNLKNLHPHDVAYLLDKEGIAIRSGFHCAQPFIEDKLHVGGTARASLYLYNTKEEIDRFIKSLIDINTRYG